MGFELWTSGIGSNRSTNWATTAKGGKIYQGIFQSKKENPTMPTCPDP